MINTILFQIAALVEKNMPTVFFASGLAFFFLALSLLLSRKSLKSIGLNYVFLYLLLFSVVHGAVEFIDMYCQYKLLLYGSGVNGLVTFERFYLMTLSFYFLMLFGLNLASVTMQTAFDKNKYVAVLPVVFLLVFIYALFSWPVQAYMPELEGAVRRLLGFPAAMLAGIGFWRLSKNEYVGLLPEGYAFYFKCASCAFIFYGVLTGLIIPESGFISAPLFDAKSLLKYKGLPVQIFRTLSALLILYFLLRAMALRILHKFAVTFLFFFCMLLAVGFIGNLNLKLISNSFNDVAKIEKEEAAFTYLYRSFNRIYDVITKPDYNDRKQVYSLLIKEYAKEFEFILSKVVSLSHDDKEEVEMIEQISALYQEVVRAQFRNGDTNSSLDELKSLIDKISVMHTREKNEAREKVSGNIINFSRAIFIILLISSTGFIFTSYLFYQFMIKPLNKLKVGAHQIAGGNLKHRIAVNTADELQKLAEDFNKMGENLLERTEKMEAANRKFSELSVRDGLTGLFNHRYFYERLGEELKRAERNKSGLSLCILDVDDFKRYNDTHGHQKGDDLLKMLGGLINKNSRLTDIACRYGGEEFGVILPETEQEGAVIIADKLRLLIQEYNFPHKETQPFGHITVTIGVSSYPDNTVILEDLVKYADDALYRAKSEGKNKVYMHEDEAMTI